LHLHQRRCICFSPALSYIADMIRFVFCDIVDAICVLQHTYVLARVASYQTSDNPPASAAAVCFQPVLCWRQLHTRTHSLTGCRQRTRERPTLTHPSHESRLTTLWRTFMGSPFVTLFSCDFMFLCLFNHVKSLSDIHVTHTISLIVQASRDQQVAGSWDGIIAPITLSAYCGSQNSWRTKHCRFQLWIMRQILGRSLLGGS
jgi:hypothetical protein